MIRQTLFAAALFAACTIGQASADIALYDGTAGDNFFGSSPGGFTFADFGSGQATDSGNSLVLDIATDLDGNNGLFGGLGRDLSAVPNFDPATSFFRIVYRPLANNAAGSFNFVLSDQDSPTTADDFQYSASTSAGTPLGNGFFEQLVSTAPFPGQFSQPSFGFSAGDNIPAIDLRQWQIQTPFGSTDRLNIEIQEVSIVETVNVPEPSSLFALMGLGAMGLVKRRR